MTKVTSLLLLLVVLVVAAAAEGQGDRRRLGGGPTSSISRAGEEEDRVLRLEYKDQPCQCNCTKRNAEGRGGRMGVLVAQLKQKDIKCIRYEAVQRRIDRGGVACVPIDECNNPDYQVKDDPKKDEGDKDIGDESKSVEEEKEQQQQQQQQEEEVQDNGKVDIGEDLKKLEAKDMLEREEITEQQDEESESHTHRRRRRRRRQLSSIAFTDQPCQCSCTKREEEVGGGGGGRMGVLVTQLNQGTDHCIKYEVVQRRIDRGRVACVPADQCNDERLYAAAELEIEIDNEEPVCPCTCQRGPKGNHWGVYIQMAATIGENANEVQCARNGRAGRSIEKKTATCVSALGCPGSGEVSDELLV